MKSLEELGVSAADVQNAINRVKSKAHGKKYDASRTTYILYSEKSELWDLKPVVNSILEEAGLTIRSVDWKTGECLSDLKKLGFAYIKFDKPKGRTLGIKGSDPSELHDAHTVYWPGGRIKPNGCAPEQLTYTLPNGERVKRITSPYVRNGKIVKVVRAAAKGKCQACGDKTFKTKSGEPYLEVHHKTWLREGGPDIVENMVALCPNCHAQEHHGTNRRYPKRNWV